MIRGTLPLFLSVVAYLLFLIYRVIARLVLKKNKWDFEKHIIVFATFIYFGALIAVTLFPLPISSVDIQETKNMGEHNNFVPFKSMASTFSLGSLFIITRTLGGNLILLSPLGVFLPVLSKKFCKLKRLIIVGFCVSLLIEISQLTISSIIGATYRTFDVDDLILNTLGIAVGYAFYKLIYPMLRKELFEFEKESI
ncbi:VanZ family protein [Bacillus sp. L381]|uniref:VanZ family protein n=1 Tax=Bacillus TaxID=1386 RepID=UPI0005C5D420|nr:MULTISPECIES: VanZ family protein [Bacillus]AOC91128.1 hypothetical protein BARD7_01658 [Bacillus amyloliquefaciens]ARW37786.1 hypothetical protein S101267_00677 [Bacillus amyloliquefaciens]AZV92033.1 hypothetical protein BUN12_3791 [Bacillus amyloliquefaciens]MBW8281902.1 VanZ family protein [Bacillus amyloliquefaciens]MCM3250461.1 VanZ family protein [Bacillus amyloliquefaciens]